MSAMYDGSPTLDDYDALPHESIPRLKTSPDGGSVLSIEVDNEKCINIRMSDMQLLLVYRAIKGALGL